MAAPTAVAKSYAKALHALATERNQTDAIARDLATLADVVGDRGQLRDFFSRPWVAAAKKRTAAAELANAAGVSPLARDFFALVAARGRATDLEAIGVAYRDLEDAAQGRVRAQVRTAVVLNEEQRRALAARLGRELGGKQVILEQVLDPDLLGGFVAEIGSLVLDGSLNGQLARLKDRLVHG